MGLQSYSLRHFKLRRSPGQDQGAGPPLLGIVPRPHPGRPRQGRPMSKRAGRGRGVKVIGFGVSRFSKDHDANRKLFEFGKAMGVDYISADPDPDTFDSLDKLTEEYGIAVGIHNHGPGPRGEDRQIAAAIKDHSPKIGCCIDTGHFLRSKRGPRPRRRGLRQADLRRPPEGREGRQDLHDPRRGRPPHGRTAQGPGQAANTTTAWPWSTRRTRRPRWPTSAPASRPRRRPRPRFRNPVGRAPDAVFFPIEKTACCTHPAHPSSRLYPP